MRAFEIPQRLLGRGALFPVRLDRVAELGQSGLGGQDQMRGIAVSFPANKLRDRIRRRRGAPARLPPGAPGEEPRGRRGAGRCSSTLAGFGAGAGAEREQERDGRGGFGGRESEQRRRMTFALQQKRVDGDADKGERQSRPEVISQMRDLHAPADLSPHVS